LARHFTLGKLFLNLCVLLLEFGDQLVLLLKSQTWATQELELACGELTKQ